MQQVLENPIIESTDTFSDPAVTGWLIKSGSMQSGSLVIEGNGAWGGVDLEAPFAEGQADSILVIINEAAQTEIFSSKAPSIPLPAGALGFASRSHQPPTSGKASTRVASMPCRPAWHSPQEHPAPCC
jgi:hypothetical protein